MTGVAQERAKLRNRLAELQAEIDHIHYALAVLDRIGVEAADRSVDLALPPAARATVGGSGSTFAVAVRVITNDASRTWQQDDLLPEMERQCWGEGVRDKLNALRSALSRAVKQGVIERVGHGRYRARRSEADVPATADANRPDDELEPAAWSPASALPSQPIEGHLMLQEAVS